MKGSEPQWTNPKSSTRNCKNGVKNKTAIVSLRANDQTLEFLAAPKAHSKSQIIDNRERCSDQC